MNFAQIYALKLASIDPSFSQFPPSYKVSSKGNDLIQFSGLSFLCTQYNFRPYCGSTGKKLTKVDAAAQWQ